MSTSNAADSPIVNSPIVNSPIVNSPIVKSPITAIDQPEYHDFSDACAGTVPAGHRVFYFKFVTIMFAVLGTLAFGLFKLGEHLGWFN